VIEVVGVGSVTREVVSVLCVLMVYCIFML